MRGMRATPLERHRITPSRRTHMPAPAVEPALPASSHCALVRIAAANTNAMTNANAHAAPPADTNYATGRKMPFTITRRYCSEMPFTASDKTHRAVLFTANNGTMAFQFFKRMTLRRPHPRPLLSLRLSATLSDQRSRWVAGRRWRESIIAVGSRASTLSSRRRLIVALGRCWSRCAHGSVPRDWPLSPVTRRCRCVTRRCRLSRIASDRPARCVRGEARQRCSLSVCNSP